MELATPTRRLWWSVIAVGVVLLAVLLLIFGQPEEPVPPGTTHDASRRGFRAVYQLLEELGYPVARSRRPAEGAVRWVIYPTAGESEAKALGLWVREGGILVLAGDRGDFAESLGIPVQVEERPDPVLGGTRVERPGAVGRVWTERRGEPIVSIYPHGAGEVWLVHRPALFTNELIGKGDNAVLVCRLAEDTLAEAADRGQAGAAIAFDEYLHGLRDRPGVLALLLEPPMRWFTLASLVFTALLLWHAMPRFGAVRPLPPPRRRSKEEFLDALAGLLERQGDFAEAYRSARAALLREIERELGIAGGAPSDLVLAEVERRRPDRPALLAALRAPAPHGSAAGFVEALRQLERARAEFFQDRRVLE